MKTIGLLLGMVMVSMMFFHPPVFAELIQGTVSGVDANANVVEVIYEDSESGELQEVNLAFVPPLQEKPLSPVEYAWQDKLKRGAVNRVTSPVEIGRQIHLTTEEENMAQGWTVGLVKGVKALSLTPSMFGKNRGQPTFEGSCPTRGGPPCRLLPRFTLRSI